MRLLPQSIKPFRVGVATSTFAWAFYCFGYIASLGTPILTAVLFSCVLVLPMAILSLLGQAVIKAGTQALILVVLAWLLAYSWLTIESTVLLDDAHQTDTVTAVQRHWPFATSSVVYVPERGVLWQD
jgi:hypothetical protein